MQKLMSSSLFIRSPKADSRTITLRWLWTRLAQALKSEKDLTGGPKL
jgi:hypothetical protein